MKDIRILSGSSNPELAQQIAEYTGIRLSEVKIKKFSNDNIFVQVCDDVRECDVFVIQTARPPVSDGILEVLLLIDALKHASAARITAVWPYFPYVRSDKKDQPRISIAARLMAGIFETAGANRFLTINLHSPQIHGFFSVPVDHLLAMKIVCDYLKQMDLSNFVAVSTDAGGAKLTESYARKLNMSMAILDKRRVGNDDKAKVLHIVGDVQGKNAMVFDDEISTAGSLMETVSALKEHGALDIHACAIHGVFCGPAAERVLGNKDLKQVITTNSIPQDPALVSSGKLKVLSVASMLGEAIMRIHKGESVSVLFR